MGLNQALSTNLKRLRKQLSLTQLELSRKSGVNYNTLLKLENGSIKNPTSVVINRLAVALNTTSETLNSSPSHFIERVQVTEKDLLPLDKLSPEDFELLCFDLVESQYVSDDVNYWGGTNDKGKDIRRVTENSLHYYQCKRTQKVSYKLFTDEIDKIKLDNHEVLDKKLESVTFLTTKRVSSSLIEKVEDYAKTKLGSVRIIFKGPYEINALVRSNEKIAGRFFDIIGIQKINESVDKFTERQDRVHDEVILIRDELKTWNKSVSKDDSTDIDIKRTSELINSGKILEARNLLLELRGKTKDKKLLAKILNNIGITYNLGISDDDRNKAIDFFNESLLQDKDYLKAKINIIIWKLYRGSSIEKKQAYTDVKRLLDNSSESDHERPLILRTYLDGIYILEGPTKAYDFVKQNSAIYKEANENVDIKYFLAALNFELLNIDEGLKMTDELLKEKYDPQILFLKARGLLLRAQKNHAKVSDYSLLPFFEKFDDIDESLEIINEILKVTNRNTHTYLYEQSRLTLATILAWKNKSEEVSEILKNKIDPSLILEIDGPVQRALSVDNFLKRKEFMTALNYILEGDYWHKEVNLDNRLTVARTFLMYGAVDESIRLLDSILLQEPDLQDTNVNIWYIYSAAYSLLNDKVGAFNAAQKAIKISREVDTSNIAIQTSQSNYASVAYRFMADHEVDRMVEASFELQRVSPDKKVIQQIKILDENKNITPEFKKQLEANKAYYEGIKNTFLTKPVLIYLLERFLERPLIDIITNNVDPEFTLPFNINGQDFKEKDLKTLNKVDTIVLDYLSLLDLAKTGLLQNINKLGKKVVVHRSLFQKIQEELLGFESHDLRTVWNFLRNNKQIDISDNIYSHTKDKLFDPWLEDSMYLARDLNAMFISSDNRLRLYLVSENIASANVLTLAIKLSELGILDSRIYSGIIGRLAERFYVFLPFSGEDLLEIAIQDNFKLTPRLSHLIRQIHRTGSDLNTFMNVFYDFISRVWNLAILPEDKVFWLEYITSNYLELIQSKGVERLEVIDIEVKESVELFSAMWAEIISRSTFEELIEIEEYVKTDKSKELMPFKKHMIPFIDKRKDSFQDKSNTA